MLRTPEVVAPVLCQPTLPFNPTNIFAAFGWFTDKSALAVDPEDLRHAKSLTVPLLGIRYQGDRKCPKQRFVRLATEFPDRFHHVDFPGRHHSTLVGDFCPDALNEVLAFFNQRLRSTPDTCIGSFPILSRTGAAEVRAEGCRGGTPSSAPHGHSLNTDKGVPCSSG
jgi:hypothetical protein